jgi:CheY-like chemotaxis protein
MAFAFKRIAPSLGALLNRSSEVTEPRAAKAEAGDVPAEISLHPAPSAAQAANDALRKFREVAPDRLASIKRLFAEVGRAPDPSARQKVFANLAEQVRIISVNADIPELRPVLQVGTGLRALFEQLADTRVDFTPSTLRTAAGAVALLEELCKSEPRPELIADLPIRLLAVDDDLVSLRAVSGALTKTFPEPDLAENGTKALELANQHAYDLIFLDIDMPDLDGFAVCSRIRQTSQKPNSPVVFVTNHSDFESRIKSTASGGRDLIAKPFSSCEITVKAWTWLYRSKLEQARKPAQPKPAMAQQMQPKPTVPVQPKPAGGSTKRRTNRVRPNTHG